MRSLPKAVTPRVVLLVALTVGLTAQEAWAQGGETPFGEAPTGPDRGIVRVGLGFGVGSLGSDAGTGIAFRGGVTLLRQGGRSITVRSTLVEEFTLWGPTPAENVWDVGVLYGVQSRSKWSYVAASGGLAIVGGTRRGDRLSPPVHCSGFGLEALGCALAAAFTPVEYEAHSFHTVGVPLEVDAGITFARGFGLGVSGFANLNPERPTAGFTVSVLLGRLR